MATHSSVLAWRIPGTGEPGGLSSLGSHRVGHDWSNLAAAAACSLEGHQPVQPSLLFYGYLHVSLRRDFKFLLWFTESFSGLAPLLFGVGQVSVIGGVLCFAECLATKLHCANQKCLQTAPFPPRGQNCHQLRTFGLTTIQTAKNMTVLTKTFQLTSSYGYMVNPLPNI